MNLDSILNFMVGLWILGFPIAFFATLFALQKTQQRLKEVSKIAGGVTDADAYSVAKHTEADRIIRDAEDRVKVLTKEVGILSSQRAELLSELKTLDLDIVPNMVRIDAYENLRSDEIKNELTMLRGKQDTLVRDGSAIQIIDSTAKKKFITTQSKQLLRCFNAECSNILASVTVKNVDSSRTKIQRSFEALNKIFSSDSVQITQAYLASKYEELSLVYAYMVKEADEREQKRAIREQMVEEEKVRRELEREKQKIEKEEAQFTNEVNKLMAYMQKAKDDIERQIYIDKIQELQDKLKDLQANKEDILNREQNTRAGFVYIISNIGSFGEHVFKIGMTRRLEPMDRIAELSSASVPFPFDVHAMIFSDDAPGLEGILHQHFNAERVNRVNPRKEFFRVDLDEIKKVVLEKHNATVKFVDIPDATEYRETLKLNDEDTHSA